MVSDEKHYTCSVFKRVAADTHTLSDLTIRLLNKPNGRADHITENEIINMTNNGT